MFLLLSLLFLSGLLAAVRFRNKLTHVHGSVLIDTDINVMNFSGATSLEILKYNASLSLRSSSQTFLLFYSRFQVFQAETPFVFLVLFLILLGIGFTMQVACE